MSVKVDKDKLKELSRMLIEKIESDKSDKLTREANKEFHQLYVDSISSVRKRDRLVKKGTMKNLSSLSWSKQSCLLKDRLVTIEIDKVIQKSYYDSIYNVKGI